MPAELLAAWRPLCASLFLLLCELRLGDCRPGLPVPPAGCLALQHDSAGHAAVLDLRHHCLLSHLPLAWDSGCLPPPAPSGEMSASGPTAVASDCPVWHPCAPFACLWPRLRPCAAGISVCGGTWVSLCPKSIPRWRLHDPVLAMEHRSPELNNCEMEYHIVGRRLLSPSPTACTPCTATTL